MNILFIVENYYPHIGGVEVLFKNLAEGLARKGHDVSVLTHRLKGTKKREVLNGVNINRTASNRYWFSLFSIPAAVKMAKNADIIHTTTFNAALPAWIAARITGKKLIITVHEVWLGMWSKLDGSGPLGKMMHELGERFIYMLNYDHYAAVSESTKRQLMRIGIPSKKISRVYNSVDYDVFNPKKHKKEKIRKKYALGKKFVYMAYGRPGISKGFEYVVMAAANIRRKIPDSKLMLILSTDPAYRKMHRKIMQLVERLQLKEHTLLVPPVAWKELPGYLKAADCVVVPSLAEGFGYTAAEASAMEIPAVVTNTTSLPEVVSGKYIFVRPKNSEEIAEAVLAVSKGNYKKSSVKRFTLKKNIEGYLGVYALLNKKKV